MGRVEAVGTEEAPQREEGQAERERERNLERLQCKTPSKISAEQFYITVFYITLQDFWG